MDVIKERLAALEKTEGQLAVVDEALRDVSLVDFRVDEEALCSSRLIRESIHTHFNKKW